MSVSSAPRGSARSVRAPVVLGSRRSPPTVCSAQWPGRPMGADPGPPSPAAVRGPSRTRARTARPGTPGARVTLALGARRRGEQVGVRLLRARGRDRSYWRSRRIGSVAPRVRCRERARDDPDHARRPRVRGGRLGGHARLGGAVRRKRDSGHARLPAGVVLAAARRRCRRGHRLPSPVPSRKCCERTTAGTSRFDRPAATPRSGLARFAAVGRARRAVPGPDGRRDRRHDRQRRPADRSCASCAPRRASCSGSSTPTRSCSPGSC